LAITSFNSFFNAGFLVEAVFFGAAFTVDFRVLTVFLPPVALPAVIFRATVFRVAVFAVAVFRLGAIFAAALTGADFRLVAALVAVFSFAAAFFFFAGGFFFPEGVRAIKLSPLIVP
jgi:hypothetical protein